MEELILKIVTVIALECPLILVFIWFVVTTRKADHAYMDKQTDSFQKALDKVLDKIGDRLDRIEDDLKIVKVKLQ